MIYCISIVIQCYILLWFIKQLTGKNWMSWICERQTAQLQDVLLACPSETCDWIFRPGILFLRRHLRGSWNRDTPKSSSFIGFSGFSLTNHPAIGVPPMTMETPMTSLASQSTKTNQTVAAVWTVEEPQSPPKLQTPLSWAWAWNYPPVPARKQRRKTRVKRPEIVNPKS